MSFVAVAAPRPHRQFPADSYTGRLVVAGTSAGGAFLAGVAAPSKIQTCSRRSNWSARA